MNWEGRKVNTVNISEVHQVKLEHYPKSDTILQIERHIQITKQEIETCRDLLHKVNSNKQERTHTPARAQFSTNLQNEVQSKEKQLQKLEKDLKKEVTARQFKLKPESYTTTVKIKIHPFATSFTTFKCKMTQIPLNANDATTGHKLQGMSKDVVIVTSWPSSQCLFKNWEYVVLSHVRSLSGLFLFHPIDLKKDFSPSDSLISYLNLAKTLETTVLNERERLMNKVQQKLQQQQHN